MLKQTFLHSCSLTFCCKQTPKSRSWILWTALYSLRSNKVSFKCINAIHKWKKYWMLCMLSCGGCFRLLTQLLLSNSLICFCFHSSSAIFASETKLIFETTSNLTSYEGATLLQHIFSFFWQLRLCSKQYQNHGVEFHVFVAIFNKLKSSSNAKMRLKWLNDMPGVLFHCQMFTQLPLSSYILP